MQTDVADESIFDFIFVAGSNTEPMDEVRGLRRETGAVVLIKGWENRVDIQFAKVRLDDVQLMMPVGTGGELRLGVPAEIVKAISVRRIYWIEHRCARSARGTDVVA